VLEAAAGDPTAFKLIDPEGLWSEPAHDLGIPLRGWNDEALATPDPVATTRRWAHRLASSAGVDEPATVAWATIERVSTGLFLHQLGHERDARSYLAVADLVAAAD
jgi:streptomycin 6-kinase